MNNDVEILQNSFNAVTLKVAELKEDGILSDEDIVEIVRGTSELSICEKTQFFAEVLVVLEKYDRKIDIIKQSRYIKDKMFARISL